MMQNPMQGGGPSQSSSPAPEEIKGKLIMAVRQLAQIAKQNGIDLMSVIQEALGSGQSSTPPRPPTPQ